MKRVNAILAHPLYRECYARLEELEKDRIFCRHQMTHLLDVARIAYISNMEQGLGIEKEVIYAAALLHDIGKYVQYEDGTPHEQSGEKIASEILGSLSEKDAFSDEENRMILTAIRGHRRLREDADVLEKLLYTSDKASRMCFACPAEGECDWSTEKKNMELKI
ncbi:HD domain-containing protein [Mediterraneibacter glycyrrhizinilyticus]|uniref:HD domain-containing protein n=1 Tax=Mediterraneibacter glycyrrhizinilyticus TaxID=342942 RepID=UPI000B3ADFA5|nr:HD domain-containing protein [Mediterraneibacter glycyrrhizinilyticus]MCF2568758.1 HD domain-containing protein [Mediterraneibacter glycyrrhizinilyticus]MDN0044536.1 HD domain-containing protein [Mediterraneibacter glycyrrhizinilyticus]OUO24869.1 HD domain-containing protein [Lachnoclostridium sp. An298]